MLLRYLHAAPLVDVSSRAEDQSEDTGGGASLANFCFIGRNQGGGGVLSCAFKKPFLNTVSRAFRRV